MMYAINFKRIILVIKPLWIWALVYFTAIIFKENKLSEDFLYSLGILFLIALSPYFLLFFQYLFYSFSKIEILNEHIIINDIKYEKSKILNIEMVSSENRKINLNPNFFPWMDGVFYYFKIQLISDKTHHLTCFMDIGTRFERDLKKYEFQYSFRNSFIPLIL